MDPRRPWTETPVHVLDFEGSRRTGIVEWGAVTLLGGRILGLRTELCAPLAPVPEAETRCHGLAAADLGGRRPFASHREAFQSFRASGILASHHAGVEATLLADTWPHPAAVPAVAEVAVAQAAWGPWVDTLVLARRRHPRLPDHGLGALVAALGLEAVLAAEAGRLCPLARRRPHCAGYDALAAALLLLALAPPEHPLAALLAAPGDGAPQGELAL